MNSQLICKLARQWHTMGEICDIMSELGLFADCVFDTFVFHKQLERLESVKRMKTGKIKYSGAAALYLLGVYYPSKKSRFMSRLITRGIKGIGGKYQFLQSPKNTLIVLDKNSTAEYNDIFYAMFPNSFDRLKTA